MRNCTDISVYLLFSATVNLFFFLPNYLISPSKTLYVILNLMLLYSLILYGLTCSLIMKCEMIWQKRQIHIKLLPAGWDVYVFILLKNDRFVKKTTTKIEKRSFFSSFLKWSFLKRSFFIKFVVSLTIVYDDSSLTIVNYDPSLTIVNEERKPT